MLSHSRSPPPLWSLTCCLHVITSSPRILLFQSLTLILFWSLCLSISLSPKPRKPLLLPEWVKRSVRRHHVLRDPNDPTHTQPQTCTQWISEANSSTLSHTRTRPSASFAFRFPPECKSPIQKTLHGCQLLTHPNYSIHILSLSISTGQPAHYDTTRSLLLPQ